MSEAPKRMWVHEGFWTSGDAAYWTDDENNYDGDVPYIREDVVLELVEALKAVVRYAGNNGDDYLADKARAALAKLEESHD